MSGGGEFVVSSSLLSHRHRLLDAVHVLIVETAIQLQTMESYSSSVAVKGKEGQVFPPGRLLVFFSREGN